MSRPKRTSRESAAAVDAITTGNPKVMFTANANSAKQKGATGSGVQPTGTGAPLGSQEAGADKMGGLPLPEVVRELLREREVLRWDFKEGVFEVMDGEEFERRFNDLRKVRNKAKAAGTERPFSRMYNFYVLEAGDKWAKTGTRFRPKGAVAQPTPEILEYVKAMEVPKSSPTPSPRSARPHALSEARSDRASSSPKVARASLQSSRAGAPSSTPSGAPVRRSNREPVPRHVPDALEQQQQQQQQQHVRAPPETHRHQPSMLPASVLGKRSAPQSSSSSRHHNAASATAAAGTSTQRSFPDKIRRILQQDGIYTTGSPRSSSTPTMMSVSSSPRAHSEHQIFGLGSPRASMSASGLPSFDSPKAHLGGIAPRNSSSPSVEEFHHYSTTMHDMESYQQEAQVRYMVQYSHPAEAEPHDQERLVEIDDASSGFPTPESILGLVGDFQGSPLDLGMPELGHLGVDFAGGSRDHTLLSSYEQDADAQWCLV